VADPVTWAAIASSAAAAGSTIIGGFNQSSQMKAQAKAAEMDARNVQLQAKQIAGLRMEEVNDVIAAVDTVRSGRGLSLDSATGRAFRKDRRQRGLERKNVEVLGRLQQRDSLLTRSSNLKSGARAAVVSGFLEALPDLISAGGDIAGLGSPKTSEAPK
jgi:hypothetical protein